MPKFRPIQSRNSNINRIARDFHQGPVSIKALADKYKVTDRTIYSVKDTLEFNCGVVFKMHEPGIYSSDRMPDIRTMRTNEVRDYIKEMQSVPRKDLLNIWPESTLNRAIRELVAIGKVAAIKTGRTTHYEWIKQPAKRKTA